MLQLCSLQDLGQLFISGVQSSASSTLEYLKTGISDKTLWLVSDLHNKLLLFAVQVLLSLLLLYGFYQTAYEPLSNLLPLWATCFSNKVPLFFLSCGNEAHIDILKVSFSFQNLSFQ